jgi:hypothetical protein
MHNICEDWCVYGLKTEFDLVDGEEFYPVDPVKPAVMRADPKRCGKSAKYYKRIWYKFWRPE